MRPGIEASPSYRSRSTSFSVTYAQRNHPVRPTTVSRLGSPPCTGLRGGLLGAGPVAGLCAKTEGSVGDLRLARPSGRHRPRLPLAAGYLLLPPPGLDASAGQHADPVDGRFPRRDGVGQAAFPGTVF